MRNFVAVAAATFWVWPQTALAQATPMSIAVGELSEQTIACGITEERLISSVRPLMARRGFKYDASVTSDFIYVQAQSLGTPCVTYVELSIGQPAKGKPSFTSLSLDGRLIFCRKGAIFPAPPAGANPDVHYLMAGTVLHQALDDCLEEIRTLANL